MKDWKKEFDKINLEIKGSGEDTAINNNIFKFKKKLEKITIKALNKQREEYEKELEIADNRWKKNEQYREKYMTLQIESDLELDKQKKEYEEKYELLVKELLNAIIDKLK